MTARREGARLASVALSDSPDARYGMRGRTRAGRLSRLDAWLLRHERVLLSRSDGRFARAGVVDLGLGDHPATTRELAQALASLDAPVAVIGVDHDARRVERARRLAPGLDLRRGGFALPLRAGERARLVRIMNVLRGYPAASIGPALFRVARQVPPGGLILEGSCCPEGRVLGALLLRRTDTGLAREALLLSTDFSRGFAPNLMRDRLPADIHRRADGGSAMQPFFAAWNAAFERVRAAGARDPREAFLRSARELPHVVSSDAELAGGELLWRPPAGVPISDLGAAAATRAHSPGSCWGDNPATRAWPAAMD